MNTRTTIDRVLDEFLADSSRGRSPAACARYAHVLGHLRAFLDVVEVDHLLGSDAGNILRAEREFGRPGAFERVFAPGELAACLGAFLAAPEWRLEPRAARVTQISLTDRFVTWLRRRGWIDTRIWACALWDLQAEITRQRDLIRGAPAPPGAAARAVVSPGGATMSQ